MDWDLVRIFQAVVAKPRLALASRAVGTSSATISRKIAEFERRLGRELFIRDSGGYRLTEFGHEVARRLSDPARSLENALQDLKLKGAARRQVVRINTLESFASFWLSKNIARILIPNDRADLDIRTDIGLVDPRFGDADIAIRVGVLGAQPLIGRSVGMFSYGIFEAPGAKQTIRYVGSIADTMIGRWVDENLESPGTTIYCDSINAAVEILASTGGRAALPSFVAREKGWSAYHPERRLESEVMVLRKRIEATGDVRTKVYNRLVREMRGFDFRCLLKS